MRRINHREDRGKHLIPGGLYLRIFLIEGSWIKDKNLAKVVGWQRIKDYKLNLCTLCVPGERLFHDKQS